MGMLDDHEDRMTQMRKKVQSLICTITCWFTSVANGAEAKSMNHYHFLKLEKILADITDLNYLLGYGIKILKIFIIILCFWQLRRFVGHIVDRMSNALIQKQDKKIRSKNEALIKTLIPIIRSILRWIISVLMILIILSELDLAIAPIIYSLGFISVSIGLGAQIVVRDLINGFLSLFEGNIAVGDIVQVGQAKGTIEQISLRSIYLRYASGALHTIPFSEATNIVNFSTDYKLHRIVLHFPATMSYNVIEEKLHSVFNELLTIESLKLFIIEPLKILGIENYDGQSMEVIATVKTLPDPDELFAFALNQKLRHAFKTDLEENKGAEIK